MFETSLVESSGRRPSRRWFSLPLSVLIHAGLIGGAVAASAWQVEEVEEPPDRVVFGDFLPKPPAGPAEKVPEGRPPATKAAAASPAAQPSVVPASLPAAPASVDPPTGGRAGIPGSVEGGGRTDGPGIGDPPVTSPPADDPPVVYRLDGGITEPVEISRVQPDYPESARKGRLQGTVVLEAVISRSGTVESVRVVRSVNPILDASAAKAVTRWRYEPARFDGRAVPVYLTVTVRFQLD